MSASVTRRDAVKSGLLILSSATALKSQANSALTVGVIGMGGRGSYVSSKCFAANEFARVAAFADIYDDKIAAGQKLFSGAKVFRDYKELLASDVDAVYIATPIVLHPEHFEAAVRARKHIFCEKAAAVDPAGCRRVLKAARTADPTKRISFDFQQRYGKDYKAAYQLVKSGQLGKVEAIRGAWIGGGPPIKSGHPAAEEKIRNWYFYKDMSGDMIVEQDCHNIDVVNWFMGTHPVKATGYGSRMKRLEPGNILDNLAATFHFADGTVFSYQANQVAAGGFTDVSETFMCENGTINTSRQGYKLYNKKDRNTPPDEVKTTYDITLDAVNEFIAGARTGQIENAAFWAVDSTLTAIMAREAIYTGKEVTWDQINKA